MQILPPVDSNVTISESSAEADGREGGCRQIRVGDSVRIRRQRWRVAGLRAYDRCTIVTLTGIGTHNAGVERRVVTPFDSVEPLERPARLRVVRMRRWRRLCRALVAEHGPASMLRTAMRARMDLLPYQLEPALAVIRGLGSRVLIADDVGLGKTIQAGLIVSELVARGAADRVLVLAPAGLREQWAGELRDRFGIDATLVDMRQARRRASELPVGVNPWSTMPIAIASVDYVKRPEVLPAALACRWDVVVVDEAHGIAPHTERHDAVAALCALAPHVALLTATPAGTRRRSGPSARWAATLVTDFSPFAAAATMPLSDRGAASTACGYGRAATSCACTRPSRVSRTWYERNAAIGTATYGSR